jgi:hypothetical protein
MGSTLRRSLVLPAVLAVLAFAASGASASGGTEIEGVWSFNGGAVGVQGLSDGSFQGTVVSPTVFATCEHPVGQVMWTGMRPRPDGSYWGLHQWFHGTKCEVNPDLGRTAWRVLPVAGGSRVLIVCFSKPGDESQPTIDPDGVAADASYGCIQSSPLAALPNSKGSSEKVNFDSLVGVPSGSSCRSSLKLRLRNPKYDPLKEVLVQVNGKKVATVHGGANLHKKIVLSNLPEGKYKVRVVAVTVLGQRFSRSRSYSGCKSSSGTVGAHRHGSRIPH